MQNKKQLANLRPIKKGERLAMKGEKPKKMNWSARIDNENEVVAMKLLEELGSQTKVINHLLSRHP